MKLIYQDEYLDTSVFEKLKPYAGAVIFHRGVQGIPITVSAFSFLYTSHMPNKRTEGFREKRFGV